MIVEKRCQRAAEIAEREIERLNGKLAEAVTPADKDAAKLIQSSIAAMTDAQRKEWISEMFASGDTLAIQAYLTAPGAILGAGQEGRLARLEQQHGREAWLKAR
jgi:hypothetical protein